MLGVVKDEEKDIRMLEIALKLHTHVLELYILSFDSL